MSLNLISNEFQFASWFRKNFKKLGYSKIVRGDISRFPDFIMLRDGKEIRVELETLSSNFLVHKHDINSVDEIVCLEKDVDLKKPVIVAEGIEFSLPIKVTLSIDNRVYRDFQKYCNENAIMLSKRIEIEMQNIMKKEVKKGGKKG